MKSLFLCVQYSAKNEGCMILTVDTEVIDTAHYFPTTSPMFDDLTNLLTCVNVHDLQKMEQFIIGKKHVYLSTKNISGK